MSSMYGVLLQPEQRDGGGHGGHSPGMGGGAVTGGGPTGPLNGPPPQHARPPLMSMAPPPQAEFASRDGLIAFQKEWAEQQGFAVVIGRSRPNRLWLKCDRGGEYSDKHLHDPENRKRKRKATRLTGCPFNVKATMKKDKVWRCHTECGEHNHPPSEDLSIHPSLRRMTDEQLQKVNEMTEAGNTPVETLEELQRLWPHIKVLRRDIYNARKKYKTEKELAVQTANGAPTGGPTMTPQPPPQQTWEDPNGKIPGPTPTGRWEWLEDGDEVKRSKKRKKSSVSTATSTPQHNFMPTHPGAHHAANLDPTLRSTDTRSPQLPSPGQAHRRGLTPAGLRYQQSNSPVQSQQQQYAPPPSQLGDNSPGRFRAYNPPSGGAQTRSAYRNQGDGGVGMAPPMRHQTSRDGMPLPQGMAGVQSPMANGGGGGAGGMGMQAMPGSSGLSNQLPGGNSAMQQNQQQGPSQGQGSQGSSQGGAGAGGGGGGTGKAAASGQVLMSRIERMEKEQRDQKAMLSQILGAVQGMGGGRLR